MKKKPKNTALIQMAILASMFVLGAVCFIVPMFSEMSSWWADEDEYREMAEQVRQSETVPEATASAESESQVDHQELPAESAGSAETQVDVPYESCEEVPISSTDVSPLPAFRSVPTETDDSDETEQSLPEDPGAAGISESESKLPPQQPPKQTEPTDQSVPEQTRPVPAAPQATTAPQPGVNLAACLAQNKDFVAWLTIPGTKIDYPVVRSDRTEHYLHHLFTGKESKLGTLFSLTSSDYRTPSRNIAIYGHHLSNSSAMFSTLMNYKSPSYCTRHSRIQLATLYGTREYSVFAVVNMSVTDWDAATASFSGDDAFMRFVSRARSEALYDSGASVGPDDHILTLITCDRGYGGSTGRLLVMAVENEGE